MQTLTTPETLPAHRVCSSGGRVYCKGLCRACYNAKWRASRTPLQREAMKAARRIAEGEERIANIQAAPADYMDGCRKIAELAGLGLIDIASYIMMLRERNKYGTYLKKRFSEPVIVRGKRVA